MVIAESHDLESELDFLGNKPVEQKCIDASEEKTGAKDEADVGEVEGKHIRDCEGKKTANGNVANHWLQGNEVSLAKSVEDTGKKMAKHENDVEGEKKE